MQDIKTSKHILEINIRHLQALKIYKRAGLPHQSPPTEYKQILITMIILVMAMLVARILMLAKWHIMSKVSMINILIMPIMLTLAMKMLLMIISISHLGPLLTIKKVWKFNPSKIQPISI